MVGSSFFVHGISHGNTTTRWWIKPATPGKYTFYNDYASLYRGKVDVTVFLTMNTPIEAYEQQLKTAMEAYFWPFRFLNGKVEIIPICDTLQTDDDSRYEMKGFDEKHKRAVHEQDFPGTLSRAFEIGKREN